MDDVKEVRVAKPEDWPEAPAVTRTVVLNTLSKPQSFKLRALSAGELRALEEALPLPEAPVVKTAAGIEERDPDNMDYQNRLAEATFGRWVMWIDKGWKTLPGSTQAEKVKWAEANILRTGEINALYNHLRMLSGLGTGRPAEAQSVEPQEADPQSWAKASEPRVGFKIPHEEATLVFELAGLPQLKINQIRDMCRPADPPLRPELHRMTKKPIPGTEKPDYTDPAYQQALSQAVLYEDCLTLEAALFPFPGNTKEEKRQWLDKRPVFEVRTLQAFLNKNVLSYRERVDFF